MANRNMRARPVFMVDEDSLVQLIREQIRKIMHEFPVEDRFSSRKKASVPRRAPQIDVNETQDGESWIDVREAAPMFGMTAGAIKNAILEERFACPTFKLGKRHVINRGVLAAFFAETESEGFAKLRKSGLSKSIKPSR